VETPNWRSLIDRAQASKPLSRRGVLSVAAVTATSAGSTTTTPRITSVETINVRDFGAKADGVTNDAPAINAAIQFMRSRRADVNGFPVLPKLLFPTGIYVVSATIELIRLQGINCVIDGDASVIIGKCAGLPVIDALGARWLTVRNLTIIGDSAAAPSLGFRVGRLSAGEPADDHRFENVKMLGHFQLACLLNLAGETCGFDHVMLWNDFPSVRSFCLIQDGLNHFGSLSRYGIASERDDSFNQNEFINCDFRHGGGGVPVWLGDTARHRFIRCFASGRGEAAFVVYCGNKSHSMLDIDCHCETDGLQNVFLFTGTEKRPTIRGFSYIDHETFAARSVFRSGPEIEKVALQNARIEVSSFANQACKMFDDPHGWDISGDVYISASAAWNGADCFSGSLLLGGKFSAVGQMDSRPPAGSSLQRPSGLDRTDAGRLFYDLELGRLIVWSGQMWLDALGGKV
jgi:hypothetical protein